MRPGFWVEMKNGQEKERKLFIKNVCLIKSGGQQRFFLHIKDANICIVVLGNKDKFIKPGKWIQDLGASTQNLMLEATNQGLASCWVGVFPKNKVVNKVRETLNLPEKLVPYAIVPIGYSEEENVFIDRFDKSKIHRNLYKK